MVIVFAILLAVAANAGLLGIPLALILLSWLLKYAFVLFDHVVRGFDEPPPLDIQMMNPANEQRPLAMLAILLGIGAMVKLAAVTVSLAAASILAVLAALLIPACIAVLGLESSILKAVYPVMLARMIHGLGMQYPSFLTLVGCYAVAVGLLGKLHLWLVVELAVGLFGFLSLFSALAGALYDRRHELGLETWHSPERTAALELKAELGRSQAVVTDAYGQVRVGAHVKAWQSLQNWLAARGNTVEDYRWLCERVASWPDPRYANRLTEEYVDRLLALKSTGEALDVVAERLRQDGNFRPKSAAATLQIAQLAARGGGAPGVARTLLGDFGTRFAGDPLLHSAHALAQHLGQ